MHSRFDQFRATALGQQLEAILDTPNRYLEFAALSRAGVAAIAAVDDELALKFPELADDATARQFCGAMAADVMRRHGHEVVQARGRVGGPLFSYGAVFSAQPVAMSYQAVVERLGQMPDAVGAFVARIPVSLWTRKPDGTGFALAEHLCHLRDLDEVFAERVHAVRTKKLPVLASVDGSVLAVERSYLAQDPDEAFAAFRAGRARMCHAFARIKPEQLARCGLRDGIRRMTIEDLVREQLDHDRTHLLELDELAAELLPAAVSTQGSR
jgi:hypothetical protein